MVCCSVLQCIAVCCSILHYVAMCCSVLQCVALTFQSKMVWCRVLQGVAVCCSVLQHVALCCNVLQCSMLLLQCVALTFQHFDHLDGLRRLLTFKSELMCCIVLQRVAVCFNVLQCVAACCSLLQCLCRYLHMFIHAYEIYARMYMDVLRTKVYAYGTCACIIYIVVLLSHYSCICICQFDINASKYLHGTDAYMI